MSIQEAIEFFKRLASETNKKSEIKVYERFINILNELKTRKFAKEEIQALEAELESFSSNTKHENNLRFFKKALVKFEKFLKDTFSLTSKDHFTRLGIGLGSAFGILFGVVFLSSFERSTGITLGLSIGMLIGLIIGRTMDSNAKRDGKALSV